MNAQTDIATVSGVRHQYHLKAKVLWPTRHLLALLAALLPTLGAGGSAAAQTTTRVVRMARLQIDAAQLASYTEALRVEIEASVRLEPGVLALNAVAEKDNPTHITILEVYASPEAYQAHLQAPHFRQYKAGTKDMVQSLQLVETVPIILKTKAAL